MKEDSLGDLAKLVVIGVLVVAGMLCPLGIYAGYQFGSGTVRSNPQAEYERGLNDQCLYFAKAVLREASPEERVEACNQLVSEQIEAQ